MRIRPSIFVVSDTHFGHAKMVDIWGVRRENHNEEMIRVWNDTIKNDDVVLHLGDLTMVNKEATKAFTLKLNGRKYLIRGNHDGNSDTWYKQCGFEVIPAAFQRFGQKDGSWMPVMFTHEPVYDLQKGWFNVHGHLHGDMHRGNVPNGDFYFDAGVDANEFKPVALFEILAKFKPIYDKQNIQ